MSAEPVVYTIPQIADLLVVSKSTIYRLIKDGQLEAINIRAHFRVRPSALNRYLDDEQRRRREGLVRF